MNVGPLKVAAVPAPSANMAELLPASVATCLAECADEPAASARAEVDVPLRAGSPHESSDIDDVNAPPAAHLNHALADHAELLVGSAASSALPLTGVVER
jgi:hypothetical protein